MQALYGEGLHPNADPIIAKAIAEGATPETALRSAALGRRFPEFATVEKPLAQAAERRTHDFMRRKGRAPRSDKERQAIRFVAAGDVLGEDASPAQRHKLASTEGRKQREAVAGYDLVFTPVKSVSTLWALGDRDVAEQVAQAHRAAWSGTIEWIEQHGALTRVGAGGVAQVDTLGLTAAAFDHYDSRAGDPNLHTHVAVSTKVEGLDGKWRSLDGRTLHSMAVTASEQYGARIEEELTRRLGLRFVERARPDGKRPTREIDGIDPDLARAFSQRRDAIEDAYAERMAAYRAAHGRDPSPATQYRLAQEATLATRDAKAAPKRLVDQRAQWRATAARVLGTEQAVEAMVAGTLGRTSETPATTPSVADLADVTIEAVESRRSTWRRYNVHAEALRVVRARVPAGGAEVPLTMLAEQVTEAVLARSLTIAVPETNPEPEALRRATGESIYQVHGRDRWTSLAVLQDEDQLVAAAQRDGGLRVDGDAFQRGIDALQARGRIKLDPGQIDMARRFAEDGREVVAGIGPAGAGKTTAMRRFVHAVHEAGGQVVAVAPSAVAARILRDELEIEAETVAKFLLTPPAVTERTIILVDEAGMTSTRDLVQILAVARANGAAVRLLGDPSQLAAVQAGGALRLIQNRVGAAELDEVHRFRTRGEAHASLLLRDGNTRGLDFYTRHGRLRSGSRDAMLDTMVDAWWRDTRWSRRDSVMIAGSVDAVHDLNLRARELRRRAGRVRGTEVVLSNESRAARGDIITTRRNDRRLRVGDTDFVRNGERWKILAVEADGSLRVRGLHHRATTVLPADYVGTAVELGYASTVHRVQGMTVDRSHTLADDGLTRETLYTALTRGRCTNLAYVVTEGTTDVDADEQPGADYAAVRVLQDILGRSGEEESATMAITNEFQSHDSLARRVPAYEDASSRVLDPELAERLRALVEASVGAEMAASIVADPAWPTLLARLAAHEAAGRDLAADLPAVVASRELATGRDRAAVLYWRIGPVDQTLDPGLPAWVSPRPSLRSTPIDAQQPEVVEWVEREAERISSRLDALVHDVAVDAPAWAPPVPAAGSGSRTEWERLVRDVVAYRDRYEVTDNHDPLGPTPRGGHRAEAFTVASTALTSLARMQVKITEVGIMPEDHQPTIAQTSHERLATLLAQRGSQPTPAQGEDRLDQARQALRRTPQTPRRRPDAPQAAPSPQRGPRL